MRLTDEEQEHLEKLNADKLVKEKESVEAVLRSPKVKSVLIIEAAFTCGMGVYKTVPGIPRAGCKNKRIRGKKILLLPAKENAIRLFDSFIKGLSSRWGRMHGQIAYVIRIETKISDLTNFKLRPHLFGLLICDRQLDHELIAQLWGAKPSPAESLKQLGKDQDVMLTAINEALTANLDPEEKKAFTDAYLARRNHIIKDNEDLLWKWNFNIGGCKCLPLDVNDEQAIESILTRIRKPLEIKEGCPTWTVKGKVRRGSKPSEIDYHLVISPNLYTLVGGYDPKESLRPLREQIREQLRECGDPHTKDHLIKELKRLKKRIHNRRRVLYRPARPRFGIRGTQKHQGEEWEQ